MKIFFLFFLSVMISINIFSQQVKITVNEKGKIHNFKIKSNIEKKILSSLKSIFNNVNQILRVRVDSTSLSEFKQKEDFIEIILSKNFNYLDNNKSGIEFSKVLIFLSGDYSADEKSDKVVLFAGKESYFGSPYSSTGSFNNLIEIKKIICNIK